MKPDLEENKYDPRHHFSGVNMQQGPVQSDADWNKASGSASAGLDLRDMDVEQAVQLIMGKVGEDSREDLKSGLQELERIRKRKAALRRAAAAMAGAGLILLLGLVFGPRFFRPADAASGPPEVNANLPAVQAPVSDAAAVIGAAPGCQITLTSPASAVELPISGPVNVQWSSEPPGAAYTLEVHPPSGAPWVIPTDGTSKDIFMENFPAGGAYEFSVSTLDASGAVLCSVVVGFEKPAYDQLIRSKEKESEGEAEGGAYCVPNSMVGC